MREEKEPRGDGGISELLPGHPQGLGEPLAPQAGPGGKHLQTSGGQASTEGTREVRGWEKGRYNGAELEGPSGRLPPLEDKILSHRSGVWLRRESGDSTLSTA